MKLKLTERILSLLLALVLLLSLTPAVFADDGTEEPLPVETEEQNGEPAAEPGEPAEEPAPGAEEPAEETELETEAAEPGAVRVVLSFSSEFRAAVPAEGEYADAVLSGEGIFTLEYALVPGVYTYKARAAGFRDLTGEFTVPGDVEEFTLELFFEACPYGIRGMGPDYEPPASVLRGRAAIAEQGGPEALAAMTPGKDYAEGEAVFLAGSREEALEVAAAYSSQLKSFCNGVAVIALPAGCSVAQALSAALDPELRLPLVEPNYIVSFGDPVSASVSASSGAAPMGKTDSTNWRTWKEYADSSLNGADEKLLDPGSGEYQYQHDVLNTYEAWHITTGSPDVKVVVLDSGIAADHEDLKDRISEDRIYYCEGFPDGIDEHGHGTHCAGILSASMGNGLGGAGVAPGITLYSYRVSGAFGFGFVSTIATGMLWAAENDMDVISVSMGVSLYSEMIYEAITTAVEAGVTIVCSAGNEGSNYKAYLSGQSLPGVITVGALDRSGAHAVYSNYGPWVDVWAPGTDILSTWKDGGYVLSSGTSMATPAVAGAAALYISLYGHHGVTPAAVEKAVKAACTGGVLDVNKLVRTGCKNLGIQVYITNGSDNLTEKYPSGTRIPANYTLEFDTSAYSRSDRIVYTLDGSDPLFFNGRLVNGRVYTEPIPLASFSEGSRVTLKAAYASPNGALGEISAKTFTVGANEGGATDPAPEKKTVKKLYLQQAPFEYTGCGEGLADKAGYIKGTDMCLKSAVLYTADIPATADVTENVLHVFALCQSDDGSFFRDPHPDIAVSRSGIVEVRPGGDGSLVIKGVGCGKAKVTASVTDSNGKVKKCSVTVTVKAPASYVDILVPAQYRTKFEDEEYRMLNFLAAGKSAGLKAVYGDTYGKPSGMKASWSVRLYMQDTGAPENSAYLSGPDYPYLTISKSGRLSVNKKFLNDERIKAGWENGYEYYAEVTCTVLCDGQTANPLTAVTFFRIIPPVKRVTVNSPESADITLSTNYNTYYYDKDFHVLQIELDTGDYPCLCAYNVKSSKPEVCSVIGYQGGILMFKTTGLEGKAVITVTAADGSGKKLQIRVTVKELPPEDP